MGSDLIRSSMEMIFRFSRCANSHSLGNLATEPSYLSKISHRTAAGGSPAKTARSTEASVCPALFNTPPSLYLMGNMWPGRLKSSAREVGDARARIVFALSLAETPVVVPSFTSCTNGGGGIKRETGILRSIGFYDERLRTTEMVNAVECSSSFFSLDTIRGSCNLSRSSPFMATQTIPVPCLTANAIASGVTSDAAIMRSPWFSLSSSSTTITNCKIFIRRPQRGAGRKRKKGNPKPFEN